MEVLHHDAVELILERVPVKSLLRLKTVSKQWKSTIESIKFQERQFNHRRQSPDPDVLFLTFPDDDNKTENIPSSPLPFSISVDDNNKYDDQFKLISSSSVTIIKSDIKNRFGCSASCDGFVCFYNNYENKVINIPTTRWHRRFPRSDLQQCRSQKWRDQYGLARLGFGKDKFNGTYKPIWLYNNSREFDKKETIIRCEFFDFSIIGGSKTCNRMHSVDLIKTFSWIRKSTRHEIKWISGKSICALKPVAVLEEKNGKSKVLYNFDIHEESRHHMVIYDGQTGTYDLAFTPFAMVSKKLYWISYFLFS